MRTKSKESVVYDVEFDVEFPKAGYTKNPPESCAYSKRFTSNGAYWVENVICAFYCKNIECRTYRALMEGSKERIKLQHNGG